MKTMLQWLEERTTREGVWAVVAVGLAPLGFLGVVRELVGALVLAALVLGAAVLASGYVPDCRVALVAWKDARRKPALVVSVVAVATLVVAIGAALVAAGGN
jgi:hypothetical protein